MDKTTFAGIHKLFCRSYNIDEEVRWKPSQKEYKDLQRAIEIGLEGSG